MINVKMIAKPKSSGSGSSSSGSKTTYITTTVSDADHAASADKATRAENADRATYADRAGTAQNAAYATVAGSLSKDAEVLDDYLYKGETDETQEVKGKVTFDDTITAKTEILAELLQSLDYSNAAEQGFSIEKEDSGKYHEYITNLTVWGKAIFHELEIRKLSYAGGNIYLSGAGSKLVKVVPVKWDSESSSWTTSTDAECEGWKCYLLADDGTTATQNYWQVGDQVKCQTFGQITSAGTYTDVSNKAYWRTIPTNGISTANEKIYDSDGNELYNGQQFAWIVIGKHSESLDGYTENTAPTETKDYPAAGDTIVLDGNRGTDTSRQNIIILETTGDDAPRIVGYHNISDYEHTTANYVFLFSAKEGVTLNSSCFKWMSADGSETNMPNYCGDWTEGTTYYKNDQVSHNNAVWICIANSGVGVTDEPSDTSSNWKKVMSGGKGDDAVSYSVNLTRGSNGTTEGLYVTVTKTTGGVATSSTIKELGLTCKAYADSEEATGLESRLMTSDNYIDFSAFENATSFSVAIYKNGAHLATGNYSKGAQGEQGKSALEIIVSPDTIVFDTNDNGIVEDYSSNSATISCYRESSLVSNISYTFTTNGCGASLSSTNGVITVKITSIYQDSITANSTTYQVSKTSGTVDVSITDNSTGTTYKAQVKFAVNVSKFTGGIMADNKEFKTKYNELTNNGAITDLTEFKSEIAQTAREISLEVSQKTVGRRNLLVGSAARKYGEGWTYMSGGASYGGVPVERIEINSGIDGTNCLHCYGSSSYMMGLRWYGASSQGNIKLEKGKTYTLSCYVKTNAAGYVKFYLQTHMMSSATATSRSYSNYHDVTKYIDYSDTWTLITNTFTMSGSYEYAEICIFAVVQTGAYNAYLCRPMLEEGDTANGWTLSEQDYDYVGGNLLDNTRTLTLGDNLTYKEGTLIEEGYGGSNVQHTDCSNSSSSMENLKWYSQSGSPLTIALNNDYVFSFWAKGSGTLSLYCYRAEGNLCDVQYENSDGKSGTEVNGGNTITLTSQWKRHWVHWKAITSPLPTSTIIRCPGYCDAYVSQPKLEEGATLTEWTERKADLIDKASLKAAGISISSSSVELYGDQIKVSSTKGGTPTALFKDGKVTASHIDVDDLMAQNLTATNLTVTGNSKFGIWEIASDSTFGSAITTKNCTINGTSYLGSVLHYTPLFVRGGSDISSYMKVGPYATEFGEVQGTGYYNAIYLGHAANIVCQGAANEWSLPTNRSYDQSYHPTAYIYAKKEAKEDPALVIKMQYATTNATYTAIATNGAVRSVLAPNVQIMTSGVTSATINTGIGIVICQNTKALTLTLPPNPVSGQMLLIISQTDATIYIKANGINIMKYTTSTEQTQVSCGKRGQFNWFVYDGTYWNCIYANGQM